MIPDRKGALKRHRWIVFLLIIIIVPIFLLFFTIAVESRLEKRFRKGGLPYAKNGKSGSRFLLVDHPDHHYHLLLFLSLLLVLSKPI